MPLARHAIDPVTGFVPESPPLRACAPMVYCTRVRPYVSSWPDPGLVYAGVSGASRKFLGGSAAQSALLQSFDALLGVVHPDAPAGAYLRTVRGYMPSAHDNIIRPSGAAAEAMGTGGTALRAFLAGAHDAATKARL